METAATRSTSSAYHTPSTRSPLVTEAEGKSVSLPFPLATGNNITFERPSKELLVSYVVPHASSVPFAKAVFASAAFHMGLSCEHVDAYTIRASREVDFAAVYEMRLSTHATKGLVVHLRYIESECSLYAPLPSAPWFSCIATSSALQQQQQQHLKYLHQRESEPEPEPEPRRVPSSAAGTPAPLDDASPLSRSPPGSSSVLPAVESPSSLPKHVSATSGVCSLWWSCRRHGQAGLRLFHESVFHSFQQALIENGLSHEPLDTSPICLTAICLPRNSLHSTVLPPNQQQCYYVDVTDEMVESNTRLEIETKGDRVSLLGRLGAPPAWLRWHVKGITVVATATVPSASNSPLSSSPPLQQPSSSPPATASASAATAAAPVFIKRIVLSNKTRPELKAGRWFFAVEGRLSSIDTSFTIYCQALTDLVDEIHVNHSFIPSPPLHLRSTRRLVLHPTPLSNPAADATPELSRSLPLPIVSSSSYSPSLHRTGSLSLELPLTTSPATAGSPPLHGATSYGSRLDGPGSPTHAPVIAVIPRVITNMPADSTQPPEPPFIPLAPEYAAALVPSDAFMFEPTNSPPGGFGIALQSLSPPHVVPRVVALAHDEFDAVKRTESPPPPYSPPPTNSAPSPFRSL